jgi:tetratricopeptide (TPR) repeat protein
VNCPDDNQLVSMVGQPSRFADLEVHIDGCEHCRLAVAALVPTRAPVGTPGGSGASDVDAVGDRYEIQRVLGRGGMGTVYLAHDRTLGRDVALKVHGRGSGAASEEHRLHREALAMAKLAHPNVVTVFEIGSFEDRLHVAMEYVRGGTLRDWLAKKRSWQQVVAMVRETGTGLAAAHDAGLVHRDFKPENVLVGSDGRPRVSDFGLARTDMHAEPHAEAPVLESTMTLTGAVVGTPAYMAPEQLAGTATDARSDQFAFCVVLWEALFGARPFVGTTIGEIQEAIAQHELEGSRAVPERVRSVIERGLAIAPGERWPNMASLLAALGEAAQPRTGLWVATAVAGTALVAIGSYATYTTVSAHRHEAACSAAGDRVRGLFTPTARATIQAAFAKSGAAHADRVFDHTAPIIGRAVDELATATTEACMDPHAPPTRFDCLDNHERKLTSFLRSLAHPDAGLVQGASYRAWNFGVNPRCATAEAKSKVAPADGAIISHIHELDDAGKYREALAAGDQLLAGAQARNDKNLEAAVMTAVGPVKQKLGAGSEMAAYYRHAEELAESAGNDAEAGAALQMLSGVDIERKAYTDAHADLELARAKFDRLGGIGLRQQAYNTGMEARLLMREMRMPEAEAAANKTLEQYEQALGSDSPDVGIAASDLSEILSALGKDNEAIAFAQRAVTIFTSAYGDDHPMVVSARTDLANSLIRVGKDEEARQQLTLADAIAATAFGPDHESRGDVAFLLGRVEVHEEHWDAALVDFRKAAQIYLNIGESAGVVSAARTHVEIADALVRTHHLDDAITEEQQAIALFEQAGAKHGIASSLVELANIYSGRHLAGDHGRALASAKRAVAIVDKVGPGNPQYAAAHEALDRAQRAR